MNQKIIDFINGQLPPQERAEMKARMEVDAAFATEVRQKKMELLVQKELKNQQLRASFEDMETAFQNRQKRRRLFFYVTAAAAVFASIFIGIQLLTDSTVTPDFTAINLTKDYNTQSFKSPSTTKALEENLAGNWLAEVQEDNQISVSLELEMDANNEFFLRSQIAINDEPRTEDRIEAKGSWELKDNRLVMTLDPSSVKTVKKKNPFEAGILELWLKENRLFRKPNEIVLLNENSLILKFNQRQGLEMQKQAN